MGSVPTLEKLALTALESANVTADEAELLHLACRARREAHHRRRPAAALRRPRHGLERDAVGPLARPAQEEHQGRGSVRRGQLAWLGLGLGIGLALGIWLG